MKNKKKTIILLIVIILILIIIITFVYQKLTANKVNYEVSIDGKTEEDQLLFNGIGLFSEKYTGNIERKEITDGLSNIIKKYIPRLKEDTKMKTDNGLKKYYEKNKSKIKEEFGIGNEQDFISFVKDMKKSSVNFKKWDKLTVNKDTFVDDKNEKYSYFEMTVTYENQKKVDYSVYLAKNRTITPRFIVNIKK